VGVINAEEQLARIKVVGVGGGGCNAVSRMVAQRFSGVQFIAMNTDAQALARVDVPIKLQLGRQLTRGLGAGGKPEIGAQSAEESQDEIKSLLEGSDMVFVTCGMGGGTGTGAAPVVGKLARESGALTIGVVTRPFGFEGARRAKQAEEGIARLRQGVDTAVVIPNDRLRSICDQQTSMMSAFKLADDCLRQGIQAISEVITIPGEINLDFADVKAIMKDAGMALMAVGKGTGADRCVQAARNALNSPLVDVSIEGAKGVLLNFTGGADLTLNEVNEAAEEVHRAVAGEANIIFGLVTDTEPRDEVTITLIATGFAPKPSADEVAKATDDQIAKLLAPWDEDDLDIPPFLRRPHLSRPEVVHLQ